jgi:hypothetical protein
VENLNRHNHIPGINHNRGRNKRCHFRQGHSTAQDKKHKPRYVPNAHFEIHKNKKQFAMKVETKKVFCCDYCSKVSTNPAGMARHERTCRKNPHTKALCYQCEHYHQAEFDVLEDVDVTVGEGDIQTFVMNPNKCLRKLTKIFNGLKWNKNTLEIFLRQGSYQPMPSIADGCPYFEAYQEPPTIDEVDKIRADTEIKDLERIIRDTIKNFDIN